MKYYLSVSGWNLLESFTTESISPFLFYSKRDYGNTLSRYLNNEADKQCYLLLSKHDMGGDYTIIIDEKLIENDAIMHTESSKRNNDIILYGGTIYYEKNKVSFRFSSQDMMDTLLAEAQILLEVKCIEKYRTDFHVNSIQSETAPPSIPEILPFFIEDNVKKDNKFNVIKGAIIGYSCGMITSSSIGLDNLQRSVRELKNMFGGQHTYVMTNYADITNQNEIIAYIKNCETLYIENIKQPTNLFGILTDQFLSLIPVISERAESYRTDFSKKKEVINRKITQLNRDIAKIEEEYDLIQLKKELTSIKEQEKRNGEKKGKTREYYPKGSKEHDRKEFLKHQLSSFDVHHPEYKNMKNEREGLQRELDSLNVNMYDGFISAIYNRISDICNDLLKKIISQTIGTSLDLRMITYTPEQSLIVHISECSNAERSYLAIVLDYLINKHTSNPISDYLILKIIQETAVIFKGREESKSENGEKILSCLRSYWQYKNGHCDDFNIPNEMPILQSIMAFFIKPFGHEQIERYMLNKSLAYKQYALMLYGACNGYAALPSTFTKVLDSLEDYSEIDLLLHKIRQSL